MRDCVDDLLWLKEFCQPPPTAEVIVSTSSHGWLGTMKLDTCVPFYLESYVSVRSDSIFVYLRCIHVTTNHPYAYTWACVKTGCLLAVFLRAQLAGFLAGTSCYMQNFCGNKNKIVPCLQKSHFQQNVSLEEEDKRLGWKARSDSILILFHKHGRHAVVFCESSQNALSFILLLIAWTKSKEEYL